MDKFYTKLSDGNFMMTQVSPDEVPMINRVTKVFKLSNGTIIKTNNQLFFDIVPKVPEGYLSAEILWEPDYKVSDITQTILY